MDQDSCRQGNSSLADLRSLILQAQEIERDIEAVVRTLQERQVDSGAYRLATSLDMNNVHLREIFAGSGDVVFREFRAVRLDNRRAILLYLQNMSVEPVINEHVIERLTTARDMAAAVPAGQEVIPYVKTTLLTAASVVEAAAMEEVVSRILLGDTALLLDGEATALIVATRDVRMRGIAEPQTENEVFGPREGFIEDLRTNITLVRRRVKNANLVVAEHVVGRRSNTDVTVVYLKGIADFKLVGEVERRLGKIDIDAPHYAGIQRQIEDHPHSPFPTIMSTERPDKFAAALLKGKVGILVDGTPFALLAPAVISDFFAAGDDYFEKWLPATSLRLLRYAAAFLAVTVPALYVAVTTFHPAMIPTPLALTIGISREGVPFPAFFEALIMILFLEVMQEAGVRMPKNIGQAVSIVGGLVIGDASVRAGLISSSLVIVTAFTAIATFSIASYRMALAIRVLRIPLMVAAASFGMFGVMIVLLIIAVHVNIIESFNEPYLAAITPRKLADLQEVEDAIIVAPAEAREKRPGYLEPGDNRRQRP